MIGDLFGVDYDDIWKNIDLIGNDNNTAPKKAVAGTAGKGNNEEAVENKEKGGASGTNADANADAILSEVERAAIEARSKELPTMIRALIDELKKCKRQLGLNSNNSGIPTSKEPFNKKGKHNGRERTGNPPGGPPGHPGYGRKDQEATEDLIMLDAPEDIRNSSDWYPTGKIHVHKRVGIKIVCWC